MGLTSFEQCGSFGGPEAADSNGLKVRANASHQGSFGAWYDEIDLVLFCMINQATKVIHSDVDIQDGCSIIAGGASISWTDVNHFDGGRASERPCQSMLPAP